MTIREKLLVKLAAEPSFEGENETEKALVKELKAEMEAAKGASPDTEVSGAAKALAAELLGMVKTMVEATKAAEPVRVPGADPNAEAKKSFDAEVEEKVKGMSDAQAKEFRKKFRFAEFAKGLYKKDYARVKALAEGTDADGGYLVPDEFRATLIEHLLQSQTIRQYATVIPMEGKLLNIPKLTSDVKVYWGTENRAIATTTADFGEMTLTPFRLNAIIYTSRELFDDSAISIFDVLRRRFVARVADEETKVFINGNGTTQPKGIDQETFRSVSAASALTPDHLTKAYYLLPEAYRAQARWLINSRVMEHLENKKDSNGQYLYPSLQGEIKTLKGRPVIVTDYVASSKIFFGDLSYYYIGDRQQVTMDVTTEAGDAWEKYQVGLRLVERVDGEVALTQAFVEITNTNIN